MVYGPVSFCPVNCTIAISIKSLICNPNRLAKAFQLHKLALHHMNIVLSGIYIHSVLS